MYGSFLKLILKLLKCNRHGTCSISLSKLVGQFPWNIFPIFEFTNRNAKSSISSGLSIYLEIDYIRKLILRLDVWDKLGFNSMWQHVYAAFYSNLNILFLSTTSFMCKYVYGITQVKCRLLISSTFYVKNFRHFLAML